jgi:hypothetical protein
MKLITHIDVNREPSEADWTLSKFYFNSELIGVGVEDEFRVEKVHGETRIPNGTYQLGLHSGGRMCDEYYRNSAGVLLPKKERTTDILKAMYHTPHEMIHVLDVPGFEYILWHWGNTDDDSSGCYIVGSTFGSINGQRGVLSSRAKYTAIYPQLWNSIKNTNVSVTYREI